MTPQSIAPVPLAAASDLTRSLVVDVAAPGVAHAVQSRSEPAKIIHVAFGEWPAPPVLHPDVKTVSEFVLDLQKEGFGDVIARGRSEISTWIDGRKTLRSLRLAVGLSQEDLAEKMNTSQSQIARIESGKQDVHLKTLRRMAEVLGVSLHDVVDATGV